MKIGYVNCLPGLALTAWRKMKRQRPSGNDPGLAARSQQPALVQRVLYAMLAFEGMYTDHVSRSLPFGHSIIALAEKRVPDAGIER